VTIDFSAVQIIADEVVRQTAVHLARAIRPPEGTGIEADGASVTITGPGVSDEYSGKPWIIAAISGA
jgi:hypothetical protein